MWHKLLEGCDNSIFSTWEWLVIWWRHFGRDKKLLLLLAQENGKITGIAPLMYSVHNMLGLRRGMIEFIGRRAHELSPDSDYNDFILTEKNEECMKLFLDYLTNLTGKWNCIDLMDIPENAQSLPWLRRSAKTLKSVHSCPYVILPKSYEAMLSNLSARERKNIRQGFRQLERDFKVDFVDCSTNQSINDEVNVFFDLHQRRWNATGWPGGFEDREFRSFHLDVARSFSRKGWLGLFLLELSGRPVAAHYGFKYQGKFYSYLSGFDPKYSKYSVGSLLTACVMRRCIECGLVVFDFMRGAEGYKNRFNAQTRCNYEAILTRKGFRTNLAYRFYDTYWRQASRLKYVVKNAPKTLARAR